MVIRYFACGNACDENLAQFPPTRLPVLVDQFKERCSLLVQLRALPVISSPTVQSMRTPRLEQFFRLSFPLEMCDSSLLAAQKVTPSNNRYDEVIKLISLFGWKPLALPDMVVGKNANVCSSPRSPPEKAEEVVILNFSNIGQISGTHEIRVTYYLILVLLVWIASYVELGIWGFPTISWPMEMFRLAGFTELNKGMISGSFPDGRNSDNRNVISGSSSGYPTSKETVSNINLSIARSPLHTNQNPKATTSFPMIGRNIRAPSSSVSNLRKHLGIDADSRSKSAALSNDGVETTEDAPGSSSENQPSSLNTEIAEIEDHLVTGNNNSNPLEGLNGYRPGTFVVESSSRSTESDA